jgi:hypothetical protein
VGGPLGTPLSPLVNTRAGQVPPIEAGWPAARHAPPTIAGTMKKESARAAQSKRHYFVPRAYLERFAVDGRVLVRRHDGGVFTTDPTNVAVGVGMYDVEAPGGGKSPEIEDMLSIIDEAALKRCEPSTRGVLCRPCLMRLLAALVRRG